MWSAATMTCVGADHEPFPEPERATFFEVNRTRLRAWCWGDPADPPVVLAHGGFDHGRMWDDFAPRLAALGFHAVAIDTRGHGDSGRISSGLMWSAATLDLCELARVLAPAARRPRRHDRPFDGRGSGADRRGNVPGADRLGREPRRPRSPAGGVRGGRPRRGRHRRGGRHRQGCESSPPGVDVAGRDGRAERRDQRPTAAAGSSTTSSPTAPRRCPARMAVSATCGRATRS